MIASVHGACAGIGMSLMMACDLAVAAEGSVFTLAYVHLGVSPDGGSTFFLPRHVGAKRAMEIAMLGDRFDAAKALARRLAQGPADALAATKRLLNRSFDAPLPAQLQAEAESFASCAATEDFNEAVAAFIAKRPPRFGGR